MFSPSKLRKFIAGVTRHAVGPVLSRHLGLTALTVALLPIAVAPAAHAQSRPYHAQVWFNASDPVTRAKRYANGPPGDLMAMFAPGAPWARVAAGIQVFKLPPSMVDYGHGDDQQLRQIFAFLRAHSIALAIDFGWMYGDRPGGCGAGIEGYAAHGEVGLVARRIARLGGDLRYVLMDEPLYYGHAYSGRRACQFEMAETARRVAEGVALIRASFPRVQIGDIEPVGGNREWPELIAAWEQAYRAATGTPLAFMIADVQWQEDWQSQLPLFARAARSQGVPFGIIYDGNGRSDEEWVESAAQRFRLLEANPATRPDEAIFMSWQENPTQLLPETRPGTLTNLTLRYLQAKQGGGR